MPCRSCRRDGRRKRNDPFTIGWCFLARATPPRFLHLLLSAGVKWDAKPDDDPTESATCWPPPVDTRRADRTLCDGLQESQSGRKNRPLGGPSDAFPAVSPNFTISGSTGSNLSARIVRRRARRTRAATAQFVNQDRSAAFAAAPGRVAQYVAKNPGSHRRQGGGVLRSTGRQPFRLASPPCRGCRTEKTAADANLRTLVDECSPRALSAAPSKNQRTSFFPA